MNTRNTSYRPNASLIHEIRMIAQSFFLHRSSDNFWNRNKPEGTVLLCAPCYRNEVRTKAVIIDGGRSVCKNHI